MPKFWTASGKLGEENYWTVDVIRDHPDHEHELWKVFCSKSDPKQNNRLVCIFAYSNSPEQVDRLNEQGFPTVEARIRVTGEILTVQSARFQGDDARRPEMEYDGLVLTIEGFRPDGLGRYYELTRDYEQTMQALDPVEPAELVKARSATWNYTRSNVVRLSKDGVSIKIPDLHLPPGRPPVELKETEIVWRGDIESGAASPGMTASPVPTKERPTEKRQDTFGAFDFEFRDVEVLGFRIELPDDEEAIEKSYQLIEPLNFHIGPDAPHATLGDRARPDFHYRPATPTVNLELLRYGSMKARPADPDTRTPIDRERFQSQHELVVRVVVGRVDEDCAQVQEPATYVPAIFVDNSWSKVLGRRFLGMDKRLSHFCVGQRDTPTARRLLPNGKVAETGAETRLADVTDVRLASWADLEPDHQPTGPRLFSMDCVPERYSNWDKFIDAPPEALLSASSLAIRRWRQEDFDKAEVRRSFARDIVVGSTRSFRAIQTTPVGDNAHVVATWKQERTWITGRYDITEAKVVVPDGPITITLCNTRDAPDGWRALCQLLGIHVGDERKITLPPGGWYRLQNEVSVTVENALRQ
jgi:hypothetical protein